MRVIYAIGTLGILTTGIAGLSMIVEIASKIG